MKTNPSNPTTALVKIKGDPQLHLLRYTVFLAQSGYYQELVDYPVGHLDYLELHQEQLDRNRSRITELMGVPEEFMQRLRPGIHKIRINPNPITQTE